MKRSGKTNSAEPSDMGWDNSFPKCVKLLQRAGWFKYFEKIDGFHSEVSYGFVNPKNPSLSSTWPTPPKDTHT